MARQRVAAGSLPLSGGRRPLLTPHSVLILTFSRQRSQHAKNQAGRYAAGRCRQAAGKRTGQSALVHGILHLDGMDHADNSPEQEMLQFQEHLLSGFSSISLVGES